LLSKGNNMIRYFVSILIVVLLAQFTVPEGETLEFKITSKQLRYKDFEFSVLFEEEKLAHEQWKIYWIVICIDTGKNKEFQQEGHIEVWGNKKFIYGSLLHRTKIDNLPSNLRNQIKSKNPILFSFSINPEFLNESWFGYQVLRDDGTVEMNCLIELKEFVKLHSSKIKKELR